VAQSVAEVAGLKTKLAFRSIVILALALGLFSVPAQAQTTPALYLAPDGNDANACTLTAPCLTLPRAYDLATPGTTIYLRSGVYYSRNEWQLSGRNTITITAYPADIVLGYERPIIDATYAGLGEFDYVIQLSSSQTVTVSHLEVRKCSGRGISSAGSSRNVTVYRHYVHHIGERCIGLVGSYITLDSSHAYECALNWKTYTGGGGWPGGVASWWKSGTSVRSDHIAIINSLIQRVYGEGVIFLHADNGLIYNSTIIDSKSVNLYIDDANWITADYVTINNTDPAFLKNGRYAHGIEIGNENGARAMTAITVTNSTIAGADNAIYFFCFQPRCGYGDLKIANNRADGRSYGIKINAADSVTGVNVLSGNVFSGTFQLAQPQFWSVVSNINSGATSTPTRTPTVTPTSTRTATWTASPTPSATPSLSPSSSVAITEPFGMVETVVVVVRLSAISRRPLPGQVRATRAYSQSMP